MRHIAVIGCGGIGTWLIDALAKFLNFNTREKFILTLADGDSFEDKNHDRQSFDLRDLHRNKAQAKAAQLAELYPNIDVRVIPEYINELNADSLFPVDYIFICVDQHASRKIIGEAVNLQKPRNIVVISGGNELDYGNVLVHIRRNNQDITPPITDYPEIKNANMDEHPDRLSCAQLAQSDPQVIFANMSVAIAMLNAFYGIQEGKTIGYGRVDVDIVQNGARPYLDQEIAEKYMKVAL